MSNEDGFVKRGKKVLPYFCNVERRRNIFDRYRKRFFGFAQNDTMRYFLSGLMTISLGKRIRNRDTEPSRIWEKSWVF
ncbi:MAG: hypothetical protein KAW56_08040 [Candidatus Marinimicrobia bacterium]|nr:hypothetical protein [Candidatus Neomarinimicrobiota bacterium]